MSDKAATSPETPDNAEKPVSKDKKRKDVLRVQSNVRAGAIRGGDSPGPLNIDPGDDGDT